MIDGAADISSEDLVEKEEARQEALGRYAEQIVHYQGLLSTVSIDSPEAKALNVLIQDQQNKLDKATTAWPVGQNTPEQAKAVRDAHNFLVDRKIVDGPKIEEPRSKPIRKLRVVFQRRVWGA